jgi:hypothetical protein
MISDGPSEARLAGFHHLVVVIDQVLTAQQHALQFHQLGEFDHCLFASQVSSHSVGGWRVDERERRQQKWDR